jgi:hypothetical protein
VCQPLCTCLETVTCGAPPIPTVLALSLQPQLSLAGSTAASPPLWTTQHTWMSVRYGPAAHAHTSRTAHKPHHLHWIFAVPLQLLFAFAVCCCVICHQTDYSHRCPTASSNAHQQAADALLKRPEHHFASSVQLITCLPQMVASSSSHLHMQLSVSCAYLFMCIPVYVHTC